MVVGSPDDEVAFPGDPVAFAARDGVFLVGVSRVDSDGHVGLRVMGGVARLASSVRSVWFGVAGQEWGARRKGMRERTAGMYEKGR